MTSFFESYRAVRREKKLGLPSDVGPMRLRAGAMVELDRGVFLMRRDGLVKSPGKENLISSVGTWRNDGGQYVSNFYLTSLGTSTSERAILQAYQDKIGGNTDYILWRPLTEVVPTSAEEWDVWLADGNGLLGEPGIVVPPDQIRYDRAVSPGDDWIEPERHSERRTDSTTGESKVYHHRSMLFARRVGIDSSLGDLQNAYASLQKALQTAPSPEVQGIRDRLGIHLTAVTPADELPEELLLADFVNPEVTTASDSPRIEIWAGFEINSTAFKVN